MASVMIRSADLRQAFIEAGATLRPDGRIDLGLGGRRAAHALRAAVDAAYYRRSVRDACGCCFIYRADGLRPDAARRIADVLVARGAALAPSVMRRLIDLGQRIDTRAPGAREELARAIDGLGRDDAETTIAALAIEADDLSPGELRALETALIAGRKVAWAWADDARVAAYDDLLRAVHAAVDERPEAHDGD